MKSSNKGNTLDDDEEYEEDFTSKKDGSSASKDAKNNDKVSAMRSKHSVTEQRRRSKINERQ
ncbi:Transcription factor BIM2, partial [Bienertia sinuspersici]